MSGVAVLSKADARQAACIGADPELFYATNMIDAEPVIKAFCVPCPVRAQCLAGAFATGDDWGILGGYTARARRALIKQANKRRQAAAATRKEAA